MTQPQPTRILVKPARRLFAGRQQWKFELQAANGRRIDPRDTYSNRDEAGLPLDELALSNDPLELVIYDRQGKIEERVMLR
jgi:hypothetical protein